MDALELARSIVPDFPTSMGRPFRVPDEQLLAQREELAAAVSELDDAAATEVAARAWRLWMAARDVAGGRRFLAEVLDGRERQATRWRALALYGDGLLAYWAGDEDGARTRNEEAFALAQELDDAEALLFAQIGLSRVAFEAGDAARSAELATAAHALVTDDSQRQAPLHMQAQAARLAGDYDAAAALFAESLELNRRIDDPSMLPVDLHNLGSVEIHRGNGEAAERYFAQLPPAEDAYSQALMRVNEAGVAYRKGDIERARELLAGVERDHFASDDRAELEWLEAELGCDAS